MSWAESFERQLRDIKVNDIVRLRSPNMRGLLYKTMVIKVTASGVIHTCSGHKMCRVTGKSRFKDDYGEEELHISGIETTTPRIKYCRFCEKETVFHYNSYRIQKCNDCRFNSIIGLNREKEKIRQYHKRVLFSKNPDIEINKQKQLGCRPKELRKIFAKKFIEGMSWDNYGNYEGGWVIDHMFPLSKINFANPEEVAIAMHHSNIRPMWFKENLRKSADLVPEALAIKKKIHKIRLHSPNPYLI